MAHLLDRLLFILISLAITVLPEQVKEHERLQPYRSTAAHLFSAYAEMAISAALFVLGMLAAVSSFSHGPAWEYLARQPTLAHRDFFAMGALGYLSYLLHPSTWLLLYCFAEGVVRAIEGLINGRHPGLAAVWAVWRLGGWLRRRVHSSHTSIIVGPTRPDEIVMLPFGQPIALEIFSVEEKPWSEMQVVELNGDFYELATCQLVRHGRWNAWRYQFLPLGGGEVIRGSIVRLSAPQVQSRHDSARTETGAGQKAVREAKVSSRATPVRDP